MKLATHSAATLLLAAGLLFTPALTGCASTGIAVKEKLGYAKREQLVDEVKDARDEQTEAKEQFESALAEFLAVTDATSNPSVAELEKRYSALKREYDRSEDAADDVRGQVKDVERVANALFKEWNSELSEYSSPDLRRASERQLNDTQRQYDRLIDAMKAAEAKMDPVLAAFKDQVLFLKHNLNARAIASLQDTVGRVESDVQRLVAEMEASINEANTFIQQMGTAQ
jgi:uncharacterized small protein (DUF1192 family)